MIRSFLAKTPCYFSRLLNHSIQNSIATAKRNVGNNNEFDSSKYNPEQIEYINSLQNLKYSELVAECNNLKLKPKDRTRPSLVQAIIEAMSIGSQPSATATTSASKTKKQTQDSTQEDNEAKAIHKEAHADENRKVLKQLLSKEEFQKYQTQQKQTISPVDSTIKKPINLDKSIQLQSLVENSELLKDYSQFISTYQQPKQAQSVYYLENYSWEQQQKTVNEISSIIIQKELAMLTNRSNFLHECDKSYAEKIRNTKDNEAKQLLASVLGIEAEYCALFKDEAKHFMKEVSGSRISNSLVLHITKNLSDPISFWHYASFFKWGSSSSLISLWKALTLSIDFYDIENIQTLTKCLYMIRKYSRFQTQEEAQFYEKLSTVILQIITENDFQISRFYIANILGYIKQIGVAYTPKTQKNIQTIAEKLVEALIVDLEKNAIQEIEVKSENKDSSNYMRSPEELDNTSPDYYFRLLLALSYCNNLPQRVISHLFKNIVDSGLAFFDKVTVIKILSQLMFSGIPINEEIAEAIRKNKKVTQDLNIREIYVFIYSFRDSNQDLGRLYHHFYYQTGLFLDNVTVLNDFKQVVMVAKIHHDILTSKILDHKRVYIEKRTNQVLNLINKSCTDAICRDYIADVIYISSLFIPYINKPDFLFSKITKNISYLKLNSENRPLFTSFVNKLLEKLQPQYDFFTNNLNQDIEFNDKFQQDTRYLLAAFIKKFTESKLLSFFLLTVQICASPGLVEQIFVSPTERHELTKNMAIQLSRILAHENNKFGVPNLIVFSQFLDINKEFISDQTVLQRVASPLFHSLLKSTSKKNNPNDDLIWINHLSSVLKEIIPNKQIEDDKHNLREHLFKNVIHTINANQIGVVSEIVHEDGIVQFFNQNVNNSTIHNVILLPNIFRNLYIDINAYPALYNLLLPKLIKEAKYWNGKQLVDNLICLNELKVDVFEIFESCSENLFSTLILYQETQEFALNTEIYPSSDKLITLLVAFDTQYRNHLIKNPNYKNTTPKRFVALNVLACFVFKHLSYSVLECIFDLLGQKQQIYFKPFIQNINNKAFNLPDDQILSFYSKLPRFISNKDLSLRVQTKLDVQISQGSHDISSINMYIKTFTKEMVFKSEVTRMLLQYLHEQPSAGFLESLLEYFSIGGIISEDKHLDTLTSYYRIYYDTLSDEAHLNMLQIITLHQIINGNKVLSLSDDIPLHEPAFFKTVNRFTIDGKEYTIPYQDSFALTYETQVPQYKIYPKSSRTSENAVISGEYDFSGLKPEQNQDVMNEALMSSQIYEYLKNQCYNHYSQQYQPAHISRFYTYNLLVSKKLNKNSVVEEQRLNQLFKVCQNEQNMLNKQTESYSNFLLDFTAVLNSTLPQTHAYEMAQTSIETGNLFIDITVKPVEFSETNQQKIGFIYVQKSIKNLDETSSSKYTLPAQTQMKIHMLEEKFGWTIFPISYDQWAQDFSNSGAKKLFIQKALGLHK